MTTLPWGKIPTNLPNNPQVWRLPDPALRVVLGAFCVAGAAGGRDTGLSVDDLAWLLRVDDPVMVTAAINSGILMISNSGTVAVAEWETHTAREVVPVATAKSSTERSRACREREKAAKANATECNTDATPCNAATVASSVANVALSVANLLIEETERERETEKHHPPQPPASCTGDCGNVKIGGGGVFYGSEKRDGNPSPEKVLAVAPSLAGGLRWVEELHYPAGISPTDRKAIAGALDSLAPDLAQAILDELTGTLLGGIEVRHMAGWCRAVAAKASAGKFTPERGVVVAARRNPPPQSPEMEFPDQHLTTDEEFSAFVSELEYDISRRLKEDKNDWLAKAMRRGLNAQIANREMMKSAQSGSTRGGLK